MFFRFFIIFYVFLFISSFVQADDVTVTVENVGQGNFVIVKRAYNDQQKADYMIVDGGTTSYTSERLFENLNFEVKSSPKSMDLTSPSKPASTKDLKSSVDDEEEIKSNILKKLRIKLGRKSSIFIKTIVVTHPDLDHYGWIKDLFNHAVDKIGHIILGGLPEDYQETFIDWLKEFMRNGTQIYFPAIAHSPIITLEQTLKDSEEEKFAPHLYTKKEKSGSKSLVYMKIKSGKIVEKKVEGYKEALDFGKDVQVSFLSINPTHYSKTKGKGYYRQSLPSDSNTDSLVLKITHGKSSMILTGDATAATYARILDDYSDNLNFLETDVLLASHHGASADGCNSLKWLKITQPKMILISSGLTQGHPHKPAYEIFKQSSRLKTYESGHTIFVADDRRGGQLRKTQKAIFTTLCSGTMTVDLPQDDNVKLAVEYGEASLDNSTALEEIVVEKESIPEDEEKDNIEIKTDETGIYVAQTPKKGKPTFFSTNHENKKVVDATSSSAPETKTPKMTRSKSRLQTDDSVNREAPNTNALKEKTKESEEEKSDSESSFSEEKKTPEKKTGVKKSGSIIQSTGDTSESSSALISQETEPQQLRKGKLKPSLGKRSSEITSAKVSAAPSTENPEVEPTKSKVQTKKTGIKKAGSTIQSKRDTAESSSARGVEEETTSSSEEEAPKKKHENRKGKQKRTGQN